MHLVLSGVPRQPITKQMVSCFLSQCPGEIDMEIICGPMVVEKEDFVAGIVIIAESHIAVHATPRLAYVDIFSCKSFDVAHARLYTLEALGLTQLECSFIPRLIPSEA